MKKNFHIISVNDKAYQILLSLKRPGQSFSGVIIERLGKINKAVGGIDEKSDQ